MLTLGMVGFGLLWATEISRSCLGLISEPSGSECNLCGLPGPNAALEGFPCASVMDCLTGVWSSLQFCTGSYHWSTRGPLLDWLLVWRKLLISLLGIDSNVCREIYRAATMLMQCTMKIITAWDRGSAITHFHDHPFHRRTSKPKQVSEGKRRWNFVRSHTELYEILTILTK